MTEMNELEQKLNKLGRDLATQPIQSERILAELDFNSVVRSARSTPRRSFRSIASIAAVAGALALAVLWGFRTETLYARTIGAIQRAQSIHVTGWSTAVPRDWPLEEPPASNKTAKHDVEMWFWKSVDGTSRSFERCGPVTKIRTGAELQEHQEDVDLLFVASREVNDPAAKFTSIAAYLRQLKDDGYESLGAKVEDGRRLRGVRYRRHGRVDEYWFDAQSDLPVQILRTQQDGDQENQFELRFRYDHSVPEEVVAYVPPKTQHVRYGGRHENVELAWKQHVEELWRQSVPFDGSVAVVARGQRQQTFEHQWIQKTPDGKYWVIPVDRDQYEAMNIDHFIRLRIFNRESDGKPSAWRVADRDLLDVEFPRCDVIVRVGTDWQTWVQSFLTQQGLELSEVREQRSHWVAQHDGRELKSWRDVTPPVPYLLRDGVPRYGILATGRGRSGSPVTMARLFEDFNETQNGDYSASNPVIVDATGLPQPPEWDQQKYPKWRDYREQVVEDFFVAADSPFFDGDEGRKMAREWFAEQFGITFREEQREATVYLIRRR